MDLQFQGQMTRAKVPAFMIIRNKRFANQLVTQVLRTHLTRLVETMQDVVGKPGPSLPGQPPGVKTGHLRDSIKLYDRTGNGDSNFQVAVEAPYAHYLEWGTEKMAPRPFMMKTYNRFKTLNIKSIFTDIEKQFTLAQMSKLAQTP